MACSNRPSVSTRILLLAFDQFTRIEPVRIDADPPFSQDGDGPFRQQHYPAVRLHEKLDPITWFQPRCSPIAFGIVALGSVDAFALPAVFTCTG
jgi:hypothetical protein